MRANAVLFWVLCAFFVVETVLYAAWGWWSRANVEWTGTVAMALCAVLSALVAFYLMHAARQLPRLPQDHREAEPDADDGEVGQFSPHSWWPVLLGASGFLLFFGLATEIWISFIGAAVGVVCLVGWVFEYYRGHFAR
ncbi:cytochrome c oxidase subunit 4 [Humibacter albus]|jgi:hypothetical protein|uniref:cytochrome c oxidase subunit 4 n=1 Tax=Humibacter albus TaxID=427754 RepID=UPI0003B47C6C|nr:cytochrome c oxidase subunit 4 [Humibacter albus]